MSLTRREAMTAMSGALMATAWSTGLVSGRSSDDPPFIPDYSRQHAIEGLVVPESTTVIGVGETGAWLALFAAIAGVKRLRLFDPAAVTERNLPHSPFAARQHGMNKAEAVRESIGTMRPAAVIEAYPRSFELKGDTGLLQGVVFDATKCPSVHDGLAEACSRAELGHTSLTGHEALAVTGSRSSSLRMGKESEAWVGRSVLSALLLLYSGFSEPIEPKPVQKDRSGSLLLVG